jgi:cytochrome c oxidase cbb3-type subunit I/II
MPRYSWLLTQKLDTNAVAPRLTALRKVGVPYPEGYESKALGDLRAQAGKIVTNLQSGMVKADADREIIALIAYLQRLGTDIKAVPSPTPPASSTTRTAQLNTSPQPNY